MLKNKLTIAILSLGLLFASSCETTELDITTDPNQLSPEQSDPNFLLNSVQLQFALLAEGFGTESAEVTRVGYMFGRDYRNAYSAANFNAEWSRAYATILADLSILYPLAEEANLRRHSGIAKVIEAYTIVTLVDFFGDVPYSEAIDPSILNPAQDSGADIYAAALDLLNSAIADFNATDNAANPPYELFYNNNYTNWVRAANSLKMKIYAQTRLVDGSAVANFNAIVASGNYIQTPDQDFQFKWGTNLINPDSRHPKYAANYLPTGAADYMANWLMGYMLLDKTGNSVATFEGKDPRMQYYFYRQTATVPGNGAPPSQQLLTCSTEPAPQHYIDGGFTFCNLPDGYWGRDHGDDDGIPPDGLLRTTWGVYPAAGNFDDNRFAAIDQGDGGGGAGITPIFLSSTVDFLRAEIELFVNANPGAARTLMLSGIQKSFTKVRSFGALDTAADLSTAQPISADADYISEVGALYDAANDTGKRNLLAKEFFVTLFGNGVDAYNFYRRTGFPLDLQPNIEPNPNSFIRSFFYPEVYAGRNSNVQQKSDVTVQVFWDNNPSSGFPAAN